MMMDRQFCGGVEDPVVRIEQCFPMWQQSTMRSVTHTIVHLCEASHLCRSFTLRHLAARLETRECLFRESFNYDHGNNAMELRRTMITVASLFTDLNADLVEAFQLGIGLGVLVLSALILFPGRREPNENGQQPHSTPGGVEAPSAAVHDGTTAVRAKHRAPATASSMRKAAEQEDLAWSPHRRLNTAVYVILLSAAIVIWLGSYASEQNGVMIPYILRAYFPRESGAFQPSSKKTKRP
jgi:hypothetical protein